MYIVFLLCLGPHLMIKSPCDVIHSTVNFHIHTLIPVKTQDQGVPIRVKSYKSQQKNKEP